VNIDENIDVNIDENIDVNIDVNIAESIDENIDENIDESIDVNIDENIDVNIDENIDVNIDENIVVNIDENIDVNIDVTIDETPPPKVTEALGTAKADSCLLILLDLSPAFDTMNHQILLSTLSGLGVSGSAHSWFASYLAGLSCQVTWRGSKSASHTLTTGVLQGSVLGSALYTQSHLTPSYPHMVSLIIAIWMTFNYFSPSPPSDTKVATRFSVCLADISAQMSAHHLKLNLDKKELLLLPGMACQLQYLSIADDNSTVSPSCSFMLYNIHRV
jgi:hypothetical protein